MRPVRSILVALLLVVAGHVPSVVAQPIGPVAGRLELAAGLLWVGGQPLGSRDANLTTGTGGTLRLFSSTSELAAAAGFEARVGVRVTRAFDVEASASYGTPELRTRVSNDLENTTGATASESVKQYTVGAGVLWYAPSRKSSLRVRPFVIGGAAYLRQLHEAATLVVTGQTYHVGGGAKLLLASRTRKTIKAVGVRLDARAIVRTKGITFDGRRSISPAAGASLFVRF
jgi:hypothetical protein